ncbi:MAG: exodeoxyribonuclease V subunit gamma [Desulfomicrobium sp.]|nr:exodeoxyribonuclease V subunit gamma [Pseudomonadota bacterium]MBV1711906.1 exodeoxyribonuclease V subunit gamma [Desulfomicrobium sp.]MBU4571083.1 exodeoxyribonuclease V subunit gamma [Pseudomonadota bacterium]MBU4593712.1 exodeoxyribonuclease V subunit gamma [Pseudomonadota bacterium]MBV1719032.1 exodeoxyribonuclease V subunit gamma [Desulfomicrobium sp.]
MEGFLLHASNRLENLAELLSEVLKTPLDPMEPETILVQSGGMQRWVSMQLARRHGVCANTRFPFPVGFAYELCRKLRADLPREYSLSQERMRWRIVHLLRGLLDEPEFAPLARYVHEDSELKSVQLAERIAYHFDQYLIFRPEWAARWENHEPSGNFLLPGHVACEAWQARLWRELIRDMGGEHRAALLQRAIARLEKGASLPDLPSRVCVFGIPTLPPVYLDLLKALSRHSQVHVFLLSPCRKYWGDLLTHRERRRAYRAGENAFEERPEDAMPLAGLGAVGKDFLELLMERDALETGLYEEPGADTMLGQLQADILDLNVRDEKTDFSDTSIQAHCCHSPLREMEVLKDLILDLLAKDTSLSPQDILVMNPDIEAYAPVIQAVFGTTGEEGIPFSISDRKPTRAAETIRLFLELLEFGQHRFEASRVCALLEAPPVRQRLGLDASDTQRVLEWMRASGVRWGLNRDFRRNAGLGDFDQNTWESGLSRLYLGYMTGAADPLGGIAPLALRGSTEQELLGRVTAWIDELATLWSRLRDTRSPADWQGCLLWILDAFFPQDLAQAEHLLAIRRTVTELTSDMGDFEADARTMLYLIRKRLDESGGESGFLASGLTFCGLKPMRSIPFRVICLTGLTSTAFPRQDTPPGFDLMAARPRPGDRSLREDDRYLFLESIISARDNLILTYPGLSQSDNAEAPPSVLVSELLDFLDRGCTVDGRKSSEVLVFRHKLQAFHPDYFSAGSRLFSYSAQNRDAAQALFAEHQSRQFFPEAGAPEDADAEQELEVDIEELTRFLAHPCRHLLRALRIDPTGGEDDFMDEEPLAAPTGLEAYGPLQDLLRRALDEPAARLEELLVAWQLLPPGEAGTDAGRKICCQIRLLAEQSRAVIGDEKAARFDLKLQLGRVTLTGRLDLHGDRIVTCRPAKTKSSDMLRLWVRHLAASAAGNPARSIHIGTDDCFPAPEASDARNLLEGLLRLYTQGMRAPLPLFPRTSLAFAEARFTGRKPKERPEALMQAMRQWEGGYMVNPEREDPHLAFLFRDAEPDWERFADLAEEIYGPILGGAE